MVKNKRVVGTGYNGSPSGEPHCDDIGCDVRSNSCVRTIHAEDNALRNSTSMARAGATLYITDYPCVDCARLVAESGIIEVVWDRDYITKKLQTPGLDPYVVTKLQNWQTDVEELYAYHGIVIRRHAFLEG